MEPALPDRSEATRSAVPTSPPARRLTLPSWLDARLVLGVLLVLVSVLVGARVLSGSDRSQLVWATSRALAPGSVLTSADLVPVQVRLFDSAALYLDASQPPPTGYVASRGLGAGELLPDDALRRPELDVDFRLVTVLVEVGHVPPDLVGGQQVDAWVTPARAPAATPAAPAESGEEPADAPLRGAQLVLPALTVSAGPPTASFGAGGSAAPVVLQVRPDDVARLLSAVSLGRLDLVRVPRSVESSDTSTSAAGPG